MRYAAEFFVDIYPPELEKLVEAMVDMQDLLGEVHDTDVYAQRASDYQESRHRRGKNGADRGALQALRKHLKAHQRECLEKAAVKWKSLTSATSRKKTGALLDSSHKS
jgi:CHAD domain-containing protein